MGNKLESIKRDLEKTKEVQAETIEKAQEDADEMRYIREHLREIPRDIDSSLLEQVELVEQASTREGVQHMKSEVGAILQDGRELAGQVRREGLEQEKKCEQTAEQFSDLRNSSFGESGGEAAELSREAAGEFRDTVTEAEQSDKQTESSYEQLLREVEG